MTRSSPVSAIVVNYNRRELLEACVRSLLAQTAPPAEIIVVDNGSSDGSVEMLEAKFGERVIRVALAENLGFAAGNNRGAAVAGAEWIALLNNDAVADARWLERMVRAGERDAAVGMVASAVVVDDRRDRLDNLGVAPWADGMSRGENHYRRAAEVEAVEAFIPSGCAMLMRRRAFVEAGGFDEGFFCYSEDTDLCLRARLLGYRCALAAGAVVYHRAGRGTLGMAAPTRIYYIERNRASILLRYYPLWWILASPVATLWRQAGLALALMRVAGRKRGEGPVGAGPGARDKVDLVGLARALLRASVDAIRRAPSDLRVRREWSKRRKAPAGSMKLWLKRRGLSRSSLFALEIE